MPHNWKAFLLGIVAAMLVGAVILFGMEHRLLSVEPDQPSQSKSAELVYPPDTVKIEALPSLEIAAGVATFEGKKELPLKISGNYAKNITIVSFKASGDNAHKSAIKVIWMDGSTETIAPGTSNLALTPGKFAKQIIIAGYSVYERKIFKDSSRRGTVEWDIRYEKADTES